MNTSLYCICERHEWQDSCLNTTSTCCANSYAILVLSAFEVADSRWREGGAVDDSSGMWTFKRDVQTSYERDVCFSDVCQPILCLFEKSSANFLCDRHSFSISLLCHNFSRKSAIISFLSVNLTFWGNPPCSISESSCFGP